MLFIKKKNTYFPFNQVHWSSYYHKKIKLSTSAIHRHFELLEVKKMGKDGKIKKNQY